MKKNIVLASIAAALAISFIAYKKFATPAKNYEFTIGILQTASHPALDAARDGFTSTLTSLLADRITFIEQNAQGSIDTMHAIAQRMHSKLGITAFYAIATPALQAIASVENQRPVIFAAVTNPKALNIASHNVTGVTDMINVQKQIALITQLTPQARTIALLYNSSELNSIEMVQLIEKELMRNKLTILKIGVQSEADMQAATESACRNADALLAPTDNSVASAIDSIAATALKYKKPLYVSDNLLVARGALAACGVDYQACGVQAAHMLYGVMIEGKKPFDMPMEQTSSDTMYINKKTLDSLGLTISESLENQIKLVE
jgi:putative ABC transport system substrate-binding protein